MYRTSTTFILIFKEYPISHCATVCFCLFNLSTHSTRLMRQGHSTLESSVSTILYKNFSTLVYAVEVGSTVVEGLILYKEELCILLLVYSSNYVSTLVYIGD